MLQTFGGVNNTLIMELLTDTIYVGNFWGVINTLLTDTIYVANFWGC